MAYHPDKHELRRGKLCFEPTHEPTEDEIAEATARIRETWSDREYAQRLVGPGRVAVEYEPVPVVIGQSLR